MRLPSWLQPIAKFIPFRLILFVAGWIVLFNYLTSVPTSSEMAAINGYTEEGDESVYFQLKEFGFQDGKGELKNEQTEFVKIVFYDPAKRSFSQFKLRKMNHLDIEQYKNQDTRKYHILSSGKEGNHFRLSCLGTNEITDLTITHSKPMTNYQAFFLDHIDQKDTYLMIDTL